MDAGEAQGFVSHFVPFGEGGMASQLAGDEVGEDAVGGGNGAQVAGGEGAAEGGDEALDGAAEDLDLGGEVIPGVEAEDGALFRGDKAVVATRGLVRCGGLGHVVVSCLKEGAATPSPQFGLIIAQMF